MEEVLVWVMGDDEGTRVLIGSFETHGVIYRHAWADGGTDCGAYRSKTPVAAASDVIGLTQRAESHYGMILEPTVLRVPPPPYGRNPNLNDWVEAEVWTVVQTRMKMQRVAEIRRKQAAGEALMITTEVPDEVLLWVMRNGTKTAILGSVRETGVIYLRWDTNRAGSLTNRTHHEDTVEHADEWLQNATRMRELEGYEFVRRPQVLLMAGPGPERSELGFWVEHTVRRCVENELGARV